MMDGWLILQQSSGSSDKDKPMMKTYDERMEPFFFGIFKFQWKVLSRVQGSSGVS